MLAELENRKSQARENLRSARAAREASAHAVAVAENSLRAAEGTVAGTEQQLSEAAARREDALRRLRGLDVLVERLEGDLRSLAVAKEALASRFAGIAPLAAGDPEALVSRRGELGDALAALGPVNLGAAEQSRRLKERLSYLTNQASDLTASREELLASAQDLDLETARRFGEVFEDLRARFKSVFSDLFAGGQADLILTDPADPLASGVDILAQPPGKRLAGLALLSGGERALTAIALLFAMAGGSASGFFVLDEVDAYLDDPNCVRFCRYLQQLAYARQFLVITHNKTTMEAAGVLHGLTMEEEGVSRVVSVRLDEAAAAGGLG
jgi:chromosome segregation protein